jgi:hypothetical protein
MVIEVPQKLKAHDDCEAGSAPGRAAKVERRGHRQCERAHHERALPSRDDQLTEEPLDPVAPN